MPTIICPWCQTEIAQEEGAEPEKWCPVCENELGGYRTITVDLERNEDVLDEDTGMTDEEDDFDWSSFRKDLREKSEDQLKFENLAEKLLDEQDAVPECPHCREYMVEAGELEVADTRFRPRMISPEGPALLEAPFQLKVYVCPACFAVSHALSEKDRAEMVRRLASQASQESQEP